MSDDIIKTQNAETEGGVEKALPPFPLRVPPSSAVADAELRKTLYQTEMAINIAIGFMLNAAGRESITVSHDALALFIEKFGTDVKEIDSGVFKFTNFVKQEEEQ